MCSASSVPGSCRKQWESPCRIEARRCRNATLAARRYQRKSANKSAASLAPSTGHRRPCRMATAMTGRNNMRIRACLLSLSALFAVTITADSWAAPAASPTRTVKIISSAGARGLVEGCTAWAEKNHVTVAMAVLDWGGNLIESHAMEGSAPNAIDTALLKAKNALRWRRPSSETADIVKKGQNMAPTYIVGDFPQPGAMPIVIDGQVVGSMGVSSGAGEKGAQAGIEAGFCKSAAPPKG